MNLRRQHDDVMARAVKREATAKEKQELDKFQVITARFIDTLYGHHSGNHPATSIDNARAVCELISGLTRHLQGRKLIPADLDLVYKFDVSPDREPDKLELLAIDIRKGARASSNFSKHADRDADKTHSFADIYQVDMLVFNMTQDYETLHCALMNQGLLDHEGEKLYAIKRSLLLDFLEYRKIFHPYYFSAQEPSADSSMMGMFRKAELRVELFNDDEECSVPAGAAACIIARSDSSVMHPENKAAEKIKVLGIWPVNIQTNAHMIRTPSTGPESNP